MLVNAGLRAVACRVQSRNLRLQGFKVWGLILEGLRAGGFRCLLFRASEKASGRTLNLLCLSYFSYRLRFELFWGQDVGEARLRSLFF